MPGIGEAWFEIGVPVEKIQADMERAHQIARTQADKIQQAITQTMEKARVVPPAMRSPTFVAAMGSDPNFDYYAYGGGAQGTRTRAGDRDFAFRETRARQNLRNIMQEMVAFEQAQAIGVLDSSPAATPQGGQGGRAPASGRRTPFAFRGLEGVSRFGEMAGPAVGVFAGLAGARFAGDIFSNAEQQRADFVQRTGRLPGPGEIPGGTSKEFDYGVPVIGHLIRAADQFSDWFHDKSALEELSKATEAGTVNMLATGKALDVMARSMQAGADITSATSDVQKARIKAELDYKETIEKARDALGNVPKGMSPDDWLTVMAPRARAVEEAAAAQRFSAIDAATKGQYGAVAGFLNTETDPEDKAVSDLLKTYDAMRQIADGNRELEERLEKAFQERLSEIRRSYKVKQYNENQDFLAQTLADETEFLARETRILQQEDEKRYARTSTFRGLLGASANRGNLFSGLWKTFSQYQDQLDRNPFDPNLRAGLKAARNAEMAEQLQGIVDQYPEGRAYATLGSLGRRGTPAEFARLRMFPGGSRLAERAMFANRLGSMTDSDRAMLRMLPGGGMLVDASQQAYNAPMSDADRAMLRRTPAGRQLLARLDQEDRSRAIAGEYDRQTGGKPLDPATMKLLGDAVKHLQDISAALKN